jgi:hypothetical protein
MNNYTEVKALPVGYSLSDNFAPSLRAIIGEKTDTGVYLHDYDRGDSEYRRFVKWAELDVMVYGV